AIRAQERLTAEHPLVPQYREELANSHFNLGSLLNEQQQFREAEAEYRAAMREQERLIAEYPRMPEYVLDLGGSHGNMGNLFLESGRPEQALPWFTKSIATLRQARRTLSTDVTVRQFLRNGYRGRARAFMHLQRWREAVPDWDQA